MEMMSCKDLGSAWYHCSKDPDGGGGGGGEDFFGLLSDRHSGDLFELVWQGASGVSVEGQLSCLPLLPPVQVVPERPAPVPPSEAEMAAWLFSIVCGEECTGEGHNVTSRSTEVDDDQIVASAKESPEKLPATDEKSTEGTASGSSERRKTSTGARRSHHAEAHKLTEKRRRSKINDKFRTLQQLVPGCDKSNQASTLDQTIQYMKSLQQQIQAMSSGCGMKPAAAAVCPVVQPPFMPPPAAAGLPMLLPAAAAPWMLAPAHVRPGLFLGPPPAMMVQYGGMLPLVHHPGAVMHATPQYPAAVAPSVVPQPARNKSLSQKM